MDTPWTKEKIYAIAMAQSAVDLGCSPDDFTKSEPVIVPSVCNPNARRYLQLPFTCDICSYGSNVVASIDMQYYDMLADYLNRFAPEHCFETPNLHVLNDAFAPYGFRVCFMAEYFLPDPALLQQQPCPLPLRLLTEADFEPLYLPEWSNALCKERKSLDRLGVGAYDGDRLVAFAACSADCDTMWQIGVDVLPAYRRRGLAAACTSRLAIEVLRRDIVPFYCCAWSNIKSARNAIRSGFRPAWAELTLKPTAYVDNLNRP